MLHFFYMSDSYKVTGLFISEIWKHMENLLH